jgi:hypothetical protein
MVMSMKSARQQYHLLIMEVASFLAKLQAKSFKFYPNFFKEKVEEISFIEGA